jgi:glycosyltransferase involved in cell wall biosynthesis
MNVDHTHTPLVTIGIPFYNDGEQLRKSITSVLNQTYQNWRLILMDDGSKDNSLQIAKSFKDPRITVISDGQNKKLTRRLNELNTMIEGKYYARMDGDDIMFPERIEKQVAYLESHPEVDVVGTMSVVIDKEDRIIGKSRTTRRAAQTQKDVLQGNSFIHPSVMGRAEWFRMHPYDDKMARCQDFDLWLRTVEQSGFGKLDEPLLFYRFDESNCVQRYKRSIQSYSKYVLRYYLQKKAILKGIFYATKIYVRLPIFVACDWLGCMRLVIQRRYSPLNEDERVYYNRIMNVVKDTTDDFKEPYKLVDDGQNSKITSVY